jgi:glycosyltransferase involved in cell wall biosynthesis
LRKRILILGPLPPTVGGITTLIEGILNSDLNNKFEISPFDTQRPTYGLTKDVWDYTLLIRIGFSSFIKSFAWTISHLMIFPFILLKKRPNIVHINTASYWVFWENGIYVLISKLLRRKVILHIHGGGFEEFYNDSNRFFKFLLQTILNISDKVFVLSLSWQKFVVNIAPASKVSIIENFVDSSLVDNFENKNRLSKGIFTALFVGGPGAKLKGLFDVIDAAVIVRQHTENILFILLACADVKGLNGLCEEKGLASNIQILDYLHGSDKAKIFLNSDVFLLPSYAEGLPITMLEAMAAGLPIIATSVGAIPDVIQNGKNGFLIKVGDSQSLADKILLLKDDPNLARQMAENNIMVIRKKYEKTAILHKIDFEYNLL